MDYLKNESYYIDLYDLHTIEECLKWYWDIRKSFEKERNNKDFKEYTDEKFSNEVHKVCSYTVNVLKGERYRHKAERIKEWIDRDKTTQEKYDSTPIPNSIKCNHCGSNTKLTSKDLMNIYEVDCYMLFMFECTSCKKRRAVHENGTDWQHKEEPCPKCGKSINSSSTFKKEVMTISSKCSSCDYSNEIVDDFKKSKAIREAKSIKDKELLEKYRSDFCLNDKDGPEYVTSMDNLSRLMKEIKDKELKEKDPVFQKSQKLKKITLLELENLLNTAFKDNKYVKLQFEKPVIDRYVVVPFMIQEANSERSEYDSIHSLQKLIKTTLEPTNWRLMSEGVSHRLGILSGRLKGYERDEDLMDIVR